MLFAAVVIKVSQSTAQQRFFQSLYQFLLGRTGSAGEVAGWVGQMAQQGQDGLALSIIESQECRTDVIEGYYNALLHRPAEPTGLNGWLSANLDEFSLRIIFEGSLEFFTNG